MIEALLEEELRRPIWVFGHSIPKNWSDVLSSALDPRHPTRHSIWTSVADYLQDRVFEKGPRMRLDVSKLLFRNAFDSLDHVKPRLDLSKDVIVKRMKLLSDELGRYRPKVVMTFSAEAFALVSAAVDPKDIVVRPKLGVKDLGGLFRKAQGSFDPLKTNVFPLLHASVARASWSNVGWMFAGSEEKEEVCFRYVGHALGELLLAHSRDWPVWCDPS